MRQKLIALAITAALTGSVNAGDIKFTNAPIPTNDLDKRSILTSQFAMIDTDDDGIYEKSDVNYNVILRSGDQPGSSSHKFGEIIDQNGLTVMAEDGSPFISNDNDFSSILRKPNGDLYMVSHFESRPAAMYLTKLQQKNDGTLIAKKTRPLDFSHVNGGWVHCAGSVSPWGTHMGSEEYPPDAMQWLDGEEVDDYNAMMARYFGVNPDINDDDRVINQSEIKAAFNPYDYGFVTEVAVENFRNAEVVKHYSMGRVAIELAYVMPDEKTVYISDDGSRVGLFRYVADTAGDLTSGKLFAAKWHQVDDKNGGSANLSWIKLGKATDQEIRDIIDSGVTIDQIFKFGDKPTKNDDGDLVCGLNQGQLVQTRDGADCIKKVKKGMKKAAAFLETSRYAAFKGATLEFEKMEGITHDPDTNTLYLAMSRVRTGMSDDEGDIQLPLNYCGAVYGLDLNKNYKAKNIYGVITGIPRTTKTGSLEPSPYVNEDGDEIGYDANGPYAANNCDLNGISEPDNITFMPGYNTLIIGEDTGQHQNDMIWAYNLGNKELTRIQTTPYGSETTSPYFYPNVNGYAYMTSVIQHPFGESDQNAAQIDEEKKGYTGYIGPLPAMD